MLSVAEQMKMVKDFNYKNKIGTEVEYTGYDGEIIKTKTHSEAQMMGSRTAIIWLEGITGCVLLRKVKAVK